MNKNKKQALESAGWVAGDAEEFLELTPEECRLVELRVAISRKVRELREKQNLTQAEVARRIRTSQPRFARIESGAPGVSLDLMFTGLFALGGTLTDLGFGRESVPISRPANRQSARRRSPNKA
jgi:DNA-binding XRE family transcriptional regulator